MGMGHLWSNLQSLRDCNSSREPLAQRRRVSLRRSRLGFMSLVRHLRDPLLLSDGNCSHGGRDQPILFIVRLHLSSRHGDWSHAWTGHNLFLVVVRQWSGAHLWPNAKERCQRGRANWTTRDQNLVLNEKCKPTSASPMIGYQFLRN